MRCSKLQIMILSVLFFGTRCLAGSARPPLKITEIQKRPDGSTVFKLAGGGRVVFGPGADVSGFEKMVGASQRDPTTSVPPPIPPRPWELPQTPRLSNGMIGWKNADGTYTEFGCGPDPVTWVAGPKAVLADGTKLHFIISKAPAIGDCSH
jgi:hypothetical protein